MYILAWTDCVKVQVSFDIRTRVYFRVSLHLANDIKPWNKNQRKRIKRDRATGIIQKLLSYVNYISVIRDKQTNTLANKMKMMLRFTDSDYPFGIFKLFLEIDHNGNKRHRIT